jgi:hypothetical protein
MDIIREGLEKEGVPTLPWSCSRTFTPRLSHHYRFACSDYLSIMKEQIQTQTVNLRRLLQNDHFLGTHDFVDVQKNLDSVFRFCHAKDVICIHSPEAGRFFNVGRLDI